VTGYIKRDGVIFVEAPELQLQATFLPKTAEGLTEWVVEFRASSEAACVMQNAVRRWEGREHRLGSLPLTLTHQVRAVSEFYHDLKGSIRERTIVRRWLFPEADDIAHPSGPPKSTTNKYLQWFDKMLNHEQRRAVTSIVEGNHRVPYLISGPPGVSAYGGCRALSS
jgi:hypothetical protein